MAGHRHEAEPHKKNLTADEQKLLDALVDSYYSLFMARKVDVNYGLRLTDVFSSKEIFLIDRNLSQTAAAGDVVAARAVSLDGITFTTGCVCPFPGEYLSQLRDNFVHLFEKKRRQMTWNEMMRKYNPYFFISMKQIGIEIDFDEVSS